MKETMKYMESYVNEINAQKSNFIFYEGTGKEDIHENDMENRMQVLYRFFIFFKPYFPVSGQSELKIV